MCVYVEVALPSEAFVLGRTLRSNPNVRIELERAVLIGTEPSSHLWIANADGESIEEAIASEPSVEQTELIDRVDDEHLVRVRWSDSDGRSIRTLTETNASCLNCVGTNDAWHLKLRFRSSSELSEWYRRCLEDDRKIEIKNVRTDPQGSPRFSASFLSDPQCEAMRTALEGGYFSVPRRITLQELAEALDVSDTAASQRLRRGLEVLLLDALPALPPEESGSILRIDGR